MGEISDTTASKISEAIRSARSYFSLEHRIATYQGRADYYRQRAIIESLKGGVLVDLESGSELVDIVNTAAVTIYTGEKIELARNAEGLYFARIEGGKYYAINIKPSQDLLKQAEEYERLAQSAWRRLFREPDELLWRGMIFRIHQSLDRIGDNLLLPYLYVKRMAEQRQLPEELSGLRELENTLRKLRQK